MAFKNNNNQKDYSRGTPAPQTQNPRPRQPRQRDYDRMYQYNQDRARPSWAQQSEPAYEYNRAMERLQPQHQPRPVHNNKPGKKKNTYDRGAEPKPTTVDQGRIDEPLYEGPCAATTASTTLYGHNLDYSGYMTVVREFYINATALNPRLPLELPFCMFQHAMVGALHARLVSIQYYENSDPLVQAFPNSLELFGGIER